MNSDFRDKLSNAATAVEITLGMVILIACIVSGIGMVAMTDMNKLFGDPAYLQARMSSACLIIIGIELIKMITSYTIDSVVDVMLLAIARQMIVEHTSPIENLIAVLSIGILFVIRKYLYISRLDRRRSKKEIEEYLSQCPCPACQGRRLRPEALAVTVGGLSIFEATELPVDEALPFLSDALMTRVASLIRVAIGYLNVYFKGNDCAQAQALLEWILGMLSGLKNGDSPCFLDKINAAFCVCLAQAHLLRGDGDSARDALMRAKALAETFDARPDYSVGALRFLSDAEPAGIYDNLGDTAMEGVRKMMASLESAELEQMWEAIQNA